MFLTMRRGFESATEKQQFRAMADKQFEAAGAVQTVEIAEAWMAPSESKVQPSKADDRKEAIVVSVSDGDQELSTVCVIERDWQTGKPTLKEPEKGESISIRRMNIQETAGQQ